METSLPIFVPLKLFLLSINKTIICIRPLTQLPLKLKVGEIASNCWVPVKTWWWPALCAKCLKTTYAPVRYYRNTVKLAWLLQDDRSESSLLVIDQSCLWAYSQTTTQSFLRSNCWLHGLSSFIHFMIW